MLPPLTLIFDLICLGERIGPLGQRAQGAGVADERMGGLGGPGIADFSGPIGRFVGGPRNPSVECDFSAL